LSILFKMVRYNQENVNENRGGEIGPVYKACFRVQSGRDSLFFSVLSRFVKPLV
jgi:hypothetical protein